MVAGRDSFIKVSGLLGLAVALLGVVVLTGWCLDNAALKLVISGQTTMMANTALCFVCLGTALAFYVGLKGERGGLHRLGQGLALLAAAVGALTIGEYFADADLGIDELLLKYRPGGAAPFYPGRMSPLTAVNFALLGAALFFFKTHRSRRLPQALALAASASTLLGIIGLLYGVTPVFTPARYTHMAVPTSIAFVMLVLGTLFSQPDTGIMKVFSDRGSAGFLARWLLPGVIGVELLTGWARLLLRNMGLITKEYGTAVSAFVNITAIAVFFIIAGRALKRSEDELRTYRESLEELVRERTAELGSANVSLAAEIATRREADEKVMKLNRVYAVLSAVNQLLVRADDRRTLLDEVCRIAVREGLFRMAWVGMLDEAAHTVGPVACAGCEEGYLKGVLISDEDAPEGRGPTGMAVRTGLHFVNNDTEDNPAMLPWRDEALRRGYLSSAAFPLATEGGTIGAFMVYAAEKGFFDEEEVALLDELAADISYALYSLEQKEKRKQAEGALAESEAKFRVLVEDSQVGIYIIQDGVLTYVNPKLAEMFGFTVKEMTAGMDVLDLVAPEYREASRDKMADVLSGEDGTQFYTLKAARKDGAVIDIELFGSRTAYRGKPAIIGTLQDVTERNRAEESLVESEEALRSEVATSAALLEAASLISRNVVWEEMAGSVAALLRETTGGRCVLIFKLASDGILLPQKASGLTSDGLKNFYAMRGPVEKIGCFRDALATKATLLIKGEELDGYGLAGCAEALGLRELVLAPIIARDKAVGLVCANFDRIPPGPRTVNIIEGIAGQLSVAYDNSRLYLETQEKSIDLARSLENLKVLSEIDKRILSTLDRDEMMESAVSEIRRVAPADMAMVLLVDEAAGAMRFSYGWCPARNIGDAIPFGQCPGYPTLASGKTLFRANLLEEGGDFAMDRVLLEDGIRSDIYVPIFSKEKGVGLLHVGCRRVAGFSLEDARTVENLASQLGIALENSRLVSDLEEMFVSVVTAFASAIDAKSPWTKGHSERVTEYAMTIAGAMGVGKEERERLRLAGLLHDIGKIGTYDIILDKPAKLTDEEFDLVKKHPDAGANILKPIKQFKDIIPIIRHHHERWDGAGYPDGLRGEDIPPLARILCVADSFDSMTADRPYRPSPGLDYAIEEFRRCAGVQFDPDVVQAFIRILGETRKAA